MTISHTTPGDDVDNSPLGTPEAVTEDGNAIIKMHSSYARVQCFKSH